jgi:hypothetical protein
VELIAIVLDAATDEYQSMLSAEQSARGDLLTLLNLWLVMSQRIEGLQREE